MTCAAPSHSRASGLADIVLCGIQTNMCVENTARMGGNFGFAVTVAIDATRTFDLATPDGVVLTVDRLMQATAANLQGGGFARVFTTDDVLAEMARAR